MGAFAEALTQFARDSGDTRLYPIIAALRDDDALPAPARYREVRAAVAELRSLALHDDPGDAIDGFLAGDDAVLAVMTDAVDVLQDAGLTVDPGDSEAAHLRRAVRWRAYSRGPVSSLHRACGADVCRGSLRLLGRGHRPTGPVSGDGTVAGRAERAMAVRGAVARARIELTYLARNRCAALRAELHEEAAGLTRRRLDRFEEEVRRRAGEVAAGVDAEVRTRLARAAAEIGLRPPETAPVALPAVPAPAVRARRLETRLVTLLGVGFGLGVALAVSRLLSGLDSQLTATGLVVGGGAGLAVTIWVVGVRGLLHDRAVVDRWAGEVCATLRSATEEAVAMRVLDAESAWMRELIGTPVRPPESPRFGDVNEFAGRERRVTDQ